MDPQANLNEQAEISKEILEFWENLNGSQNLSPTQIQKIDDLSYRLAELCQAYCEWKRRGGF